MNNQFFNSKYFWPFVIIAGAFFFVLLLPFIGIFEQNETWPSPTEKALKAKMAKENQGLQNLRLDLVDAGQAPEEIRQLVRLGYNIMLQTPQYAAAYVGDRLSCTNCHFSGGNSTGGRGAGLSLVGVAATYPSYNARSKTVMDLPARINNCFQRSMNGKPLPLNSREMLALVTYLHWISKGVPIYDKVPWLGWSKLSSSHVPNPKNGKIVYSTYCAMCHGKDGLGEIDNHIPPVWGPKAFNDAAGLSQQDTLASFIYYNMPYEENIQLTEEQALDVAAFIIRQPHPKDAFGMR